MRKPTFLILTSKWPYESKAGERICFVPQSHFCLLNEIWIRRKGITYVHVHLYGVFNSVDNIAQRIRCGFYDRWIEVRLGAGVRDILSPKRPHWLWGKPNPLGGSFPTTDRPRDEVSSHLYLVPKLRMSGPITSVPHTPSLLAPTVELKSCLTNKIYSNIWTCVTEC
jgi:hypothetical protein